MKYHYVYRITNTYIKKHYYGTRSSDSEPKNDLGIKYFSSSRDKDFLKDQKLNLSHYKYKIIKLFDNRIDAIQFEIKLHNKFNVGKNKNFYNRAKQSSTRFDISGFTVSFDLLSNKVKLVSSLEYDNSPNLIRYSTNKVHAIDTRTNTMLWIDKNIFDSKEYYVGHDKGKVSAIDKRDGKIYKVSKELFDSYDFYVGVNYGKNGHDNTNAKRITLYNYKGEIICVFNGNLVKKCKEIGIAPYLIINSHKSKIPIKTSGKYKIWNGYYAIYKDEF